MTDEDEIERVRAGYQERDAQAASQSRYTWSDPAYAAYMQDLEWVVLDVLRSLPLHLGGTGVLDVGTGTGYFAHRLLEYGAGRVSGVDLMPERVHLARSRYPAISVIEASGTALPFDDGSFDLVTQFACLSSVLDPNVRRAIGAEMVRVTRPGGVVLSFDLGAPRWIIGFRRALRNRPGRRSPLRENAALTPVQALSRTELESIFGHRAAVVRRAGFPEESWAMVSRAGRNSRLAGRAFPLRSHLVAAFRINESRGPSAG